MQDVDDRTAAAQDNGPGRSGFTWFSTGVFMAVTAAVGLIAFGVSLDDIVDGALDRLLPSANIAAGNTGEIAELRGQLDEAHRRNSSLERELEQASKTIRELESELRSGEPSSGVTQEGTESVAVSRSSRLTELEPIVEEGLWSVEPASVGGNDFGDAITIATEWGDVSDRSWAEYAVNEAWDAFSAEVGIQDGGHSSEKAEVTIYVDDERRKQVHVGIGEAPEPVTVDLTGAERLRVEVVDLSNSAYAADVVIGEPELRAQ